MVMFPRTDSRELTGSSISTASLGKETGLGNCDGEQEVSSRVDARARQVSFVFSSFRTLFIALHYSHYSDKKNRDYKKFLQLVVWNVRKPKSSNEKARLSFISVNRRWRNERRAPVFCEPVWLDRLSRWMPATAHRAKGERNLPFCRKKARKRERLITRLDMHFDQRAGSLALSRLQ